MTNDESLQIGLQPAPAGIQASACATGQWGDLDCPSLTTGNRHLSLVIRPSSFDIRHSPPRVYIAPSRFGRGLFAGEPLAPRDPILEFTGPELTLTQVRALGPAAANALQIGIDRYLYLDEPGRYANHACSPNAAVIRDRRLVAIRPISAGEEICFDYSTTISDGWTMACGCGSPECRGLIVAFQLLPEPLRRRYALLGHVQRFIIDLVGS